MNIEKKVKHIRSILQQEIRGREKEVKELIQGATSSPYIDKIIAIHNNVYVKRTNDVYKLLCYSFGVKYKKIKSNVEWPK